MASLTTLAVNCPPGVWTLLVDGATYNACNLQSDGAVCIAVAGATPAVGTGDYIELGQWPVLTLALSTGDKVYGRPSNPNSTAIGTVRLTRTSIA